MSKNEKCLSKKLTYCLSHVCISRFYESPVRGWGKYQVIHLFISPLQQVLSLKTILLFYRCHCHCHNFKTGNVFLNYYMSTAVRNVVKAISVLKAKPQTSTHRARETLGATIVILTPSDYVISLTNRPKFHYGTLRRLGWAIGWHITTLWLFYLFIFFIIRLSRTQGQPEPSDTYRCVKNASPVVRKCLPGVWLMPYQISRRREQKISKFLDNMANPLWK